MNTATVNADGFGYDNGGKTANQRYKESGSKKPFKEWLVEMQKEGFLYAAKPKKELTEEERATRGERTKDIAGAVGSGIGQIFELTKGIVGMVNEQKDRKKQDKQDKQLSKIDDFGSNPTPAATAGIGGVPMGVWYGVGAVTVLIVGYYVYKNIVADSGTPAAPAAPAK